MASPHIAHEAVRPCLQMHGASRSVRVVPVGCESHYWRHLRCHKSHGCLLVAPGSAHEGLLGTVPSRHCAASVRRRHHRCTEVSMCCTELRTNSSSTLIPNFAAPPSMQLQPLWLPQFSAISAPLFLHSTHASVRRFPECDCTFLVALGVLRRLHPSETGRHPQDSQLRLVRDMLSHQVPEHLLGTCALRIQYASLDGLFRGQPYPSLHAALLLSLV
mmetsp:Transcript_21427/g.39012  ORF Transcript_21427/g.39012 Transcript_21427/m.39012 type:complete len:217 (-) Transcript_21427:80-730(-)